MQTQLATLSASHGVVVLSAPSGFGKTTLLEQHVATLDGPGLFVDLPQTGGVADMVRAFAAALGLGEFVGLSAIVADAKEPSRQWLALRWLADRMREANISWTAIDDLGRCAPDVRTIAARLIERVPACHWCVVLRHDSELPSASLIASGRVATLSASTLAFDVHEVAQLAELLGVRLDATQARQLVASTSGWPVAVALALQSRAGPLVGALPASARARLGEYVEQRMMPDLSECAREAMSWAPYLARLEPDALEALGVLDASAVLADASHRLPLLREAEGIYIVHDLLLERLTAHEKARPSQERRARWRAVGDVVSRYGSPAAALRAYVNAEDDVRIATLLAAQGELLIERGFIDDVSSALTLARGAAPDDMRLTLLEATVDSARGRHDRAEHLFRSVVQSGGSEARIAAVRLATLLVNRGRSGGAEMLAPYADGRDADVETAYAVALAAAGRATEARAVAVRAAAVLCTRPEDGRVACAWQRLALAHHFLDERDLAKDRCEQALEIAEREGLAAEVARIRSLLYSIAIAEDDDDGIVRQAGAMAEAARRAGMRQIELAGLTALLIDAAERGDDEAFERHEAAFAGKGPVRGYADAFPYALAKAMGDVVRRRYASARERMNRVVRDRDASLHVLSCAAAVAALTVASEGRDAARIALASLRHASPTLGTDPRAATVHSDALTQTIIAFLEASFGQAVYARRAARLARKVSSTARERALAHAAHAVAESTTPSQRREALSVLHAAGLSGYARLLALAVPSDVPAIAALTALEHDVLCAYCARRTAKDIADESGRKVTTVRTHVRNICRKLGASGRDSLIAIARSRGLLQHDTQR